MPAEWHQKIIQRGVRRLALRPLTCVLALFAGMLSAFSLSVFRYMRSFPEVEQYYNGELQGILLDSISMRSLLLVVLLAVFYLAAFHLIRGRHLGSAVVALLLGFNMQVSLSMEHSDLREIFLPVGIVENLAVLLGFAALLYTGIELLYLLCDRKTRYRIWADELNYIDSSQLVLGATGCILLLWLPIIFLCYPGSVMNDTRYQIMSWIGLKQMNASNPVLTTAFYGILYQIGAAIGGQEKGIFLGILAQAIVTAAAMGLTCACTYRYTRSKNWYWLSVAFFGLLPVWQNAAQVLLKDVLHTACFLFFVCVYMECLRKREKSWRNVLLLFLAAILVAYTRKATFYLAVICILAAALYHWRRFLLPYLAMLCVFVGLFWFSNNVLYPWLNIGAEWESENYSLQFQQVALYCRTYGDEMTDEEIAIIDSTLDFDTIVREYTPMISDGVKGTFHDTWKDHSDFWALYRQMMRRHPMLFVKSAIMGSFEHFNPWFEGVDFRVYIARQEDFLTVDYHSNMHDTLYRLWTDSLRVPGLRVLIGTGLYAWFLLIAIAYSARKKSGLAFLGLLPAFTLMIGLLMSHVNGEIRYGYPLVASVPLSFAWVLYAVSRSAPENPRHGTARLEKWEPFRPAFFKLLLPEESTELPEDFDPEKMPPAPSAWEEAEESVALDQPGPVLRFIMRYIPVSKKPKAYLELLKVLAIFLALWNYTSNGFDLYNRVLEMPQHMLYLCFSIFDKIAVPLFFMCSGAVLLGREESVGTILKKRVWRFVWILLVVSGISYVMYYRNNADFSLYDFLVRLYSGNVLTPLWYLYSYLAMLLMLPFLRKLARTMRERDYFWLLGMYLLIQLISVLDFFWFHGERYHSSNFAFFINQNYLFFTLFGFYIDRVMKKERLNLETLTMLTMMSLLCIGATYLFTQRRMEYLGEWSSAMSQTFFNTLIAVPSITVFYIAKLWFTRHPASGRAATVWSLLGTGTFGVYLFERYWRNTAQFAFDYAIKKLGSFPSSLIHILVACILGIAATLAYKLVTGILKDIFNRFRKARDARMQERDALVYTVPAEDISDLEEIETLLNHPQQSGHVYERKDNEE